MGIGRNGDLKKRIEEEAYQVAFEIAQLVFRTTGYLLSSTQFEDEVLNYLKQYNIHQLPEQDRIWIDNESYPLQLGIKADDYL